MKTEICKEQYAASMTAMPASSKEQNRSLKRGLSRQEQGKGQERAASAG